jgi:predicted ArsR family transcriptional regulator
VAVTSPLPGAGLSPTDFSSLVTAITSAFGDPTRRDTYLFAHERPAGVTTAQVAERFEVHPNVARHHLDKLVAGGYLEVTVDKPEHGGAGRPSKRYRATEKDAAIDLPIRHDDILVTLLGRALAMLPPAQAAAMAEEVGVEFGKAMAAAMGDRSSQHRSFRAALHAVADALTAHGFAARAEGTKNDLRIVSEHCPFGDAVIEHPVICAVDRGLVRGMLGALYGEASAELESSLPMGDSVCVTSVDELADSAPASARASARATP